MLNAANKPFMQSVIILNVAMLSVLYYAVTAVHSQL
jgi:hypothetical protein